MRILLTLFLVLVTGCATVERPEVDSLSDAIATKASEIESVATQVHILCGNTEPGGDCLPGAVLDTDTKNDLRDRLQEAQDIIVLANTVLAVNDEVGAQGRLLQVESILRLIREELSEHSSSD